MCDQGYNVIFKSKNIQIESIDTSEIVVEVVRTDNNVFVLKERRERCFLENIDESWLWHKILGRLNFAQIVNLS